MRLIPRSLTRLLIIWCGRLWFKSLRTPAEITFWNTPTAGRGLWYDGQRVPYGRFYVTKMLLITTFLPFLVLFLPVIATIALMAYHFIF